MNPPVKPPVEWFHDPGLSALTPLTVDDDGRVFGHVAGWGAVHIGIHDREVVPPRSKSGYSQFRLGELVTASGERVRVGQITLETDHAPDGVGRAGARGHYDHTGTAVADVAVGEDRFGVWVAGGLRPGVSDETIRVLTASKLSGDWRGGELVGLLSVNVPGFPIPRALAASAAEEAAAADEREARAARARDRRHAGDPEYVQGELAALAALIRGGRR